MHAGDDEMTAEMTGDVSESLGSFLKQQRLARGLTLGEISRATKVKERLLELVEQGRTDELPAPVFVRGFVLAYARQVGVADDEALARLRRHLGAPAAEPAPVPPPVDGGDEPLPLDALGGLDGRRRFGVALVVLLLLLVATLTLSLLLRHGPPPGALS
jgi:cytoskeletal protein RodZ